MLIGLLSYMTQDHLASSGSAHRGLGPPPSIINKEDASQTHPQVYLMEAIPSSQMTPAYVK